MYPIREATLDDLNAIEALIEASAWGLATGDYSHAQIRGALAGAWGVDTQLIRDGTYFVVEASTLIAAGGWSYRQTLFGNDTEGGRDPSRIDPARGAAKIRAFFVHPDHARKGIGSVLMAHCEMKAREMGYRALELMATLPGTRLYRQHGFHAGEPVDYALADGLTIQFVPMTRTLATQPEKGK